MLHSVNLGKVRAFAGNEFAKQSLTHTHSWQVLSDKQVAENIDSSWLIKMPYLQLADIPYHEFIYEINLTSEFGKGA